MLKKLSVLIVLAAGSVAGPVAGQDKTFRLQAPDALTETGFLKHLLPRFSLKTGVRISAGPQAGDAAFGDAGTPVFKQGDKIWHLIKTDGPHTDAFQDWLLSDVGKRTIEAFMPQDSSLFSADVGGDVVVAVAQITGDTALGEKVSLNRCGRCHVVNETNKMNAIGSTPSFGLMRNFDDWETRFQSFYVLKPHPAFTQVTDLTEPFPDNLPSPISPIEVTLEELDAIVAYVATIPPADLGAPVQGQ